MKTQRKHNEIFIKKEKRFMNQTDKGILIFYEWLDAMDALSAKQFKLLLTSICRYQQTGEEPPIFKGNTAILASMIFPLLRRRYEKARAGRAGVYARYGLDEESIKIQETINRKLKEK